MTTHNIAAHSSNYSKGRTKPVDRIVLHFTAGDGDTAENNGRYFAGKNRKASAHYFVDENSVVASVSEVDTAWHAGNWEMNCRSIGVEMCSKKDSNGNYYIPEATVQLTAELVKGLMVKYDVPITGVIRHYDVTGKVCPAPMVENLILWSNFQKMLQIEEKPKGHVPVETPASWAAESWQACADNGLLDGTRPMDVVTRQELAVVLHRLLLN